MGKEYIQKGILPDFDENHSFGGQVDIDAPQSRFNPGDAVWCSALKCRAKIVWSNVAESKIAFGPGFAVTSVLKTSCVFRWSVQFPDQPFEGQDDNVSSFLGSAPQKERLKDGFWIETFYRTVNGKQYGPYRRKRWRDEKGRKRSHYLGKAGS